MRSKKKNEKKSVNVFLIFDKCVFWPHLPTSGPINKSVDLTILVEVYTEFYQNQNKGWMVEIALGNNHYFENIFRIVNK